MKFYKIFLIILSVSISLFGQSTFPFEPQTKEELQTAVNLWVSDNASALATYGEINTWNVSLMTDMSGLFNNKTTFNDDISNWDVSNVTNMFQMFIFADSFNQSLNNWDVSSVTTLEGMFYSADSFNGDVSGWNVSSVTNMQQTFDYTPFAQDISGWDVSNVTNMASMFSHNSSFNVDISAWNVSSVTTMNHMFEGASSFNADISAWNVSSVTVMWNVFYNANNFNADISAWNVSNVTVMANMFKNASSFNQDLSNWNISNVTNMGSIFDGASALSEENQCAIQTAFSSNSNWPYDWSGDCIFQPQTKAELQTAVDLWTCSYNDESCDNDSALATYGDINTWDVSLITDMGQLFMDKIFNDDIGNWDVSSVTNMERMFQTCRGFNQDISGWDVSGLTTMSSMFHDSWNFNADISSWDVSNVTTMRMTFEDARKFNQDISSWDVSSVTNMELMFVRALDFNQNISGWDVSNVTTMDYLFWSASSFNQDISAWNVSNVTTMAEIFYLANGLSDANKCAINASWLSNENWPYDWSVSCQNTYVPDDNFEQALIDLGYDDILDDFVETIKISSITELEIEDRNIEDLTGISDFTNLQILRCMYNQLTVLDLSQNTALLELEVGENQLDTLDLSNNTDLITLYAWENNLQSIDLSHNTKLEFLDIGNNPLTNLDVSQNELLVGLETWGINLTSLDVSNNDSLRYLHIGDCQLEELNISSNVFLEELSIVNNNIQELDISNNTKLYWLDVTHNNLTALDVSVNTELEYLYAWEANLSELNISNNPNLRELGCGWNQLSSLDISNSINLETLLCANNQLTVLDLSANTNLHNLGFESNLISSINLDNNNQLRELWCGDNQLTELNLTDKVNLEYVDISGNNIEDFEYATLSNLVYLGMERTGISGDHDFSNHPSLHELFISYNNISSVTLNNPDLRYFAADSADLVSIDFSNSPLLEAVSVHGNNLTSLDLSEKSSLYFLNCGFNNLFEINLKHGSEQFEEFWADGNQNLGCILVSDVDYHAERFNAENGMIDEGVIFDEDCAISLEQLASKWKIASEPGALKVGPNFLGDLWWANSEYDIEDRGCYFDDKYVLHPDGQFENIFFGETWLEEWQTDTTDSAESFNYCGEPISPHNGMNTASWSYDSTAKKITVHSTGAFIGLPKVFNGGELTQESSVTPDSIKYDIVSMGEGVMSLSINIGSGYWTFKMIESLNEPPIFSSEPNDSVHAGSEYNYPITIIDENIDSVFIQIEELPHWLSLVEGPDGMSLIGIPFADDIGVHEVTLIVFDLDGESSSQNFSIVVYNSSPVAFDQSYIIAEDEGVVLELAVNDLDQDQIEYFIQNSPSNGILESDEGRNTSLYFDGSDDEVKVNGDDFISGNEPRTVSVWAAGNGGNIISLGDGHSFNKRFSILVNGDGFVRIIGESNDWETNYYLPQDQMTNLVVTHDGSTVRLYADGEFQGETEKTYDTDANMPIMIGTDTDNRNDEYFNGIIDDVSVWRSVLSIEDIQILYQDPKSVMEVSDGESLIGYWDFNEGSGDIAFDASPNQNNGIVYSATWNIEEGSNESPNFTYTPYNNFHGDDFFTYVAFDGFDYSELATVTIEVKEVNDAPQAFGDHYVIGEDDTLHADLHAEDGDYYPTQQQMQSLTYSITSDVVHGDLMVNDTSGAFMYTPHPNFFGADSFYYAATDNGITAGEDDFLSDTAMVHLFVEPINDAPVLSEFADTLMVEDSSLVLSVFASDIDNSDLSVYAYSSEDAVMAYVEDTLLYIYAEENWNGSVEIVVVANDNMSRATDVEQFMLTVTAVNDAPFFTMEEFSASGDITAGVDSWVHADDIDSDIFFFLEGAPSWLMMDGSRMMGQPDEDSVYVFTLSVSDSEYVVSASFELTIVDHRPHVISLTDVPQDQGRQMKIRWEPGHMDEAGYFTQFSIWREVPTDTADLWDFITSVPWIGGEDDYSRIVPTLGDSTVDTTYYSTFRVTAHTEDVAFYHDSEPVEGYSIDNLHPTAPQGLMVAQNGLSVILEWLTPEEEDFSYHNVYRNDLDNSDPAMVFTTSDSFYVDLDMVDGSWEYWVTAVDSSGNESDASESVSLVLANEEEIAIPMVYNLEQNYPNPFNPSTQIRYALPEQTTVTISIYDMMGRQVRALVNQSMSPGYHTTLWNATNDQGLAVSAGMYIYTIQAGSYHHMKKMVLLK